MLRIYTCVCVCVCVYEALVPDVVQHCNNILNNILNKNMFYKKIFSFLRLKTLNLLQLRKFASPVAGEEMLRWVLILFLLPEQIWRSPWIISKKYSRCSFTKSSYQVWWKKGALADINLLSGWIMPSRSMLSQNVPDDPWNGYPSMPSPITLQTLSEVKGVQHARFNQNWRITLEVYW